jgi:hypothetical protein
MPFVRADGDVAHPPHAPRPLDALPGATTGTVVAPCSCLGPFTLSVSMGGRFARGICHWTGSLRCVHFDDCE